MFSSSNDSAVVILSLQEKEVSRPFTGTMQECVERARKLNRAKVLARTERVDIIDLKTGKLKSWTLG